MSNGIPALLNGAQIPFQILTQARAIENLALDYFGLLTPRYGIYLNGKLVLEVDGFIDLSTDNDSQIANYRIEKGSFASYNKVISPFQIKAVVAKEGASYEINDFLDELEKISNDLNLYDVVTKDITYSNCNLKSNGYRKESANGAYILYAELIFKEILLTEEAAFTQDPTKSQSAQNKKSGGRVQATAS